MLCFWLLSRTKLVIFHPLKLKFSKDSLFVVSTSSCHIAASTADSLASATSFHWNGFCQRPYHILTLLISVALIVDQSLLLESSSPFASGVFYYSGFPPMSLHCLCCSLGAFLLHCDSPFMLSFNLTLNNLFFLISSKPITITT